MKNMSTQSRKTALITGVTGQDGAYLSEFLLQKGYVVHGIKRRSSQFTTSRVDHLLETRKNDEKQFHLHHGDMTDGLNLTKIIEKIRPDEVYNLAAQSHVAVSFEMPEYTTDVDGVGTLRLLDAIKTLGLQAATRFYQASTSELFGLVREVPQSEQTPFYPRSPYAAAKLYAYWTVVNYREAYGMFACNGILFNHESPLRGETFVTRKITRGLSRIKVGLESCLFLGNLDAKRDWGHAKDYVEMQWLMLQQQKPVDYVIATGRQHSVREFVEAAATELDLPIRWRGSGVEEVGVDKKGNVIVAIDPRYFRPTEVESLLGDSSKAQLELGWKPRITFKELVEEMASSDLLLAEQELRNIEVVKETKETK